MLSKHERCRHELLVKPPTLIKQRYIGDCSVASLAMFLGISYDEILPHYPEEIKEQFSTGVWNHRTFEVAYELGVTLTCIEDDYDLAKPSLIIAPSLNRENTLHTMFWDGKKLYDPAIGKCYDSLPKNIAYVFQEYE